MIKNLRNHLKKLTLDQLYKKKKFYFVQASVVTLSLMGYIPAEIIFNGMFGTIETIIFALTFGILLFMYSILDIELRDEIFQKEKALKQEKKSKENAEKKKNFFADNEIVNILCKKPKGGKKFAIIIYKLQQEKEISLQAELIEDKIHIHIKMNNGIVYRSVVCFDNMSAFEKNFISC